MFRKEFLIISALAVMIFSLAALAGLWVAETIKKDASSIALDSLPGVVDAGAATATIQENWLRTHALVNSSSSAERAALAQQIRTQSTEKLWRDYADSIYEPQDRLNFHELVRVRTNFLALREQFLRLAESQQLPEARSFLDQKLTPAYESYRAMSEKLFQYNAQVGRERASRVIRVSRLAPWVLAFAGVVLFGSGVLVGLRGAFTGLDLASRPSAKSQGRLNQSRTPAAPHLSPSDKSQP